MKLLDLAGERRWCAWRTEFRGAQQKPTKVPYGAGGRLFESNNPNTWITLAEAQATGLAVGIALGPLGDGVHSLIGIDYDTCLGADMAPWATGGLKATREGYAEISPSGSGVKQFLLMQTADYEGMKKLFGFQGDNSKHFKLKSEAAHPPGFEICLNKRFFTVTWEALDPSSVELETFGFAEAHAFIELGIKALLGRDFDLQIVSRTIGPRLPALRVAAREGETIEDRLRDLAMRRRRFAGLLAYDRDAGELSADAGRSEFGFAIAGELKGAGWSYEDSCEAMLCEAVMPPLVLEWIHEHDERQVARAWERAPIRTGATATAALNAVPLPSQPEGQVINPGLPPYSDEALAQRMVDEQGAGLRYVAAWGKWMVWDGVRWAPDEVLAGLSLARAVCHRAAVEASPKESKSIASGRTIHAVEGLARADGRVARRTDHWDRDPWLLNTPGGIVDLRNGRLGPCNATAAMTRATRVVPDMHGQSGRWLQLLNLVTGGDAEIQHYLQRVAGYCLTGETFEDALFFLHGTGGNGKSTFVDTLVWILGEEGYAQVVGSETFASGRGDRHLTELARLRGARLVATSETEEGRGWNEARIKAVTGGSPITANFMRQDLFTFTPEFKLIVSGNHKPRIRTPDVAMRRRINLIPFGIKIPDDMKDVGFAEKLRADAGQILGWMVSGCLSWQKMGLSPPKSVTDATAGYMAEEDSRSLWFGECVSEREEGNVRVADLFASWRLWAERANEPVGYQRGLIEWLQNRGYVLAVDKNRHRIYPRLTLSGVHVSNPIDNQSNDGKPVGAFAVIEGGKGDSSPK